MKINGRDRSFFHWAAASSACFIGLVINFSAANDYAGVWFVPMKVGFLFEPTLIGFGLRGWLSTSLSCFMTLLYLIFPVVAAANAKVSVTLGAFFAILGLSFFNLDGVRQVAQYLSS